MSSSPLATVGILSIGEMGMGIAKLLVAHNFRVVTNIEGRSDDTRIRAQNAGVEALSDDVSLVAEADYILSIVPPRDAMDTATRISVAFNAQLSPKTTPFYYLDLNAISPSSARSIAEHIATRSPSIKFLDGGIIGGAPQPKPDTASPPPTSTTVSSHPSTTSAWQKPSIPICGDISSVPASYSQLSETLGLNHISNEIGIASGLKCSFASLSKGFTALCIQSFTTASNLGVLPLLLQELEQRMPGMLKSGTWGVTSMPPKAYRWVREMQEISKTHAEEGGFPSSSSTSGGVFAEIATVYQTVAEDTVLGEEKTERRKRGRTIEDVAAAIGEGLANKRKKKD